MHTRRCTLRGCVSPWRSPLSVGSLSDAQKWNEWACGSTSGSCVSVARSSSASPVCAPRPYVSLFSCRSFPSLCVFVGVEVLVLLWYFCVCVCVCVCVVWNWCHDASNSVNFQCACCSDGGCTGAFTCLNIITSCSLSLLHVEKSFACLFCGGVVAAVVVFFLILL